ncbi:MAG: protease HtpX [Vicinamibacterales bacterium]
MMKRVFLFIVTNLAITLAISVVLSLLGIGGYRIAGGRIDYSALMVFCLLWGMGGAFISLQISRWSAKRMMGVQLVDGRTGHEDADWVYRTVERLTRQAQLPMPEVGIYDSAEVNAFATGPSKSRSLVAVSSGLLRTMRRDEAEAVLAHEVSHIGNGDMVTMTLIQGVVNAFVLFLSTVIANIVRNATSSRDERGGGGGYMIEFLVRMVLQVFFGILGGMVVAWFSRAREFRADAGAAALSGRQGMINALRRLQGTQQLVDTSEPELATMKISSGGHRWMMLLSTHPPLEQRIAALESLR